MTVIWISGGIPKLIVLSPHQRSRVIPKTEVHRPNKHIWAHNLLKSACRGQEQARRMRQWKHETLRLESMGSSCASIDLVLGYTHATNSFTPTTFVLQISKFKLQRELLPINTAHCRVPDSSAITIKIALVIAQRGMVQRIWKWAGLNRLIEFYQTSWFKWWRQKLPINAVLDHPPISTLKSRWA